MAILNVVMPYVALIVVCMLFFMPLVWGFFFTVSLLGSTLGVLEDFLAARQLNLSLILQPLKSKLLANRVSLSIRRVVFSPILLVLVPLVLTFGWALQALLSYSNPPQQLIKSTLANNNVASNASLALADIDGESIYNGNCAVCHQANGLGVSRIYPPLAGSNWVLGEPEVVAKVVIAGLGGEIVVKGETYNNVMPGFGAVLSAAEIAAVTNFVRSAWDNEVDVEIDAAAVDQLLAEHGQRGAAFSAEELGF